MSEPAATRLARLLAMVPWLRAHDGVTIQQAAEHFQVSVDQLTTDLWQLIVCGIPGYGPDQLVDIQFWDDDRIHVLDPMTLDRPLRLTGEEAAALVVALRVLAQVPGEHDREALRSAMGKLEQAASSTPDVDVEIEGDPAILDAVSEAIAGAQGLEVEYASASRDSITRRVIAPRASYTVEGFAYVEAWCEQAQDIRTFRVDRILAANVVPAPRGAEGALGADLADARLVETTGLPPDAPRARIAVDPNAAWVWDSDPVEPDGATWLNPDDGREWPTGRISYASDGYLLRFCLGRGPDVALLEPEPLRERLVQIASEKLARLRTPGATRG